MKYTFKINGSKVTLVDTSAEFDQLITQENYPEREDRPDAHAALVYDEEQGIHWEYTPFTGVEKRKRAYKTEKLVEWDGDMLTVDAANKIWQQYAAEDSAKAAELTTLIAAAKADIRERYPDSNEE